MCLTPFFLRKNTVESQSSLIYFLIDQNPEISMDSYYRTITSGPSKTRAWPKLHENCPVENSFPTEWSSQYKPIKNRKYY